MFFPPRCEGSGSAWLSRGGKEEGERRVEKGRSREGAAGPGHARTDGFCAAEIQGFMAPTDPQPRH